MLSIGAIYANGIRIGDLYYKLYLISKTAEVTNKSCICDADYCNYNDGWQIETVSIPTYVTYEGVTYPVTRIGSNAFSRCKYLTKVIIPYGVKSIENGAFEKCINLTSINIPNSVKHIGSGAFSDCRSLPMIFIPDNANDIGDNVFEMCPNLTIYSSSSVVIPDFPINRIKIGKKEQFQYNQPLSLFVKEYVEESINNWQQKDEFEKSYDWKNRVNEQTRQQKVKELLEEAERKYIEYHQKNISVKLTLGKYDADNEVFAMTDEQFGTSYIAVPFAEARSFKENWDKKELSCQLQIKDDKFILGAISITMPNGKEYTYRNTDAVNYNLADVEYNFEPLDINIPQTSAQATVQGKQNITTTKIKVGKSIVDTDIPETKASNPNTFVIIFANEDYKNVSSVPYAKNDGTIFQKYCQKTLGIPVSNIHYVENASFNDMRIQLAWLSDVCNAFDGNASIIVYYAGHGIPDESSKSAYLLPVDGDGRYVQSAYKLDDMYQKLGAMNAKSVTVFMDACFSGSKREEGMLASARGVALKVKSGVPQGNMVVFSAATGDETAYPNNEEQHGMFTYYLLKKLQETKGEVTLKALGEYITTNVRQQSIVKNGKSQTPCVTPSATLDASWQNWKLK